MFFWRKIAVVLQTRDTVDFTTSSHLLKRSLSHDYQILFSHSEVVYPNISAVIQLFQAEVLQRPRTCPNNAGCVQADL